MKKLLAEQKIKACIDLESLSRLALIIEVIDACHDSRNYSQLRVHIEDARNTLETLREDK